MPIGLLILPVVLVLTALFLGVLAVIGYALASVPAAVTHRHHGHVRS